MGKDIDSIIKEFQIDLETLETHGADNFLIANEAIILSHDTLKALRRYIVKNGFGDIKEEIHFFKNIKVLPQSHLFYYEKVLSCEAYLHPMSPKKQQKYLEAQMDEITHFFTVNSIFVNYLRLRRTDMDDRYFTRKHLSHAVPMPANGAQYDKEFNTMHDRLLAKVRAEYRYMEHINRQLVELRYGNLETAQEPDSGLEFQGNKIDLVELVYALHAAKVFKGDPDIIVIQRAVERVFNVRLGNIYTRFQEIQQRKGERSRFLPQLLKAFVQLLEDGDGLHPIARL
ncbi:MAG: RteC domain-containing protein [Bacteroidota bacterium]